MYKANLRVLCCIYRYISVRHVFSNPTFYPKEGYLMKLQRNVFVPLLFSLWLLAGCVSVDGTPFTNISVPGPSSEESEESATAESPATPKVEFPLLPMSDGEPLSALEVFELVSPS